MFNKLKSLAIFHSVVECGSFRAAAKHLGLAPSRVSQTVSDLERDIGVTLLYRSTRQIALTNEGRILHQKAREMLDAAETGLDAIGFSSLKPAGALRISVPAFVTQTNLMAAFASFAKQYPNIKLDFHFTDERENIIKGGFDMAIRAGWLEDSELMSLKIGEAARILVASPEYLAAKSVPKRPQDLNSWDWIHFAVRPKRTELFSKSGKTEFVEGASNISVNSAQALYEFAVRGCGLTTIPEHLAHKGFVTNELKQVLPNWSLKPLGLYAVWPNQSQRQNLTTTFVRFLKENADETAKSTTSHS